MLLTATSVASAQDVQISGDVTLDGGTIAPGNSIGTLTTGSESWLDGTFSVALSGSENNLDLTYTAVPEPSRVVLLAFGRLSVIARDRRP